jgi:hypothetical protein
MSEKDGITSKDLYAGISGCELNADSFELGEGVKLTKTYAHLMAPFIMAFAPPGPNGIHPAPWRAAQGGFGFDIHVELHIPANFSLSGGLDQEDTIWLIAALLRIIRFPFVTVPVLSDTSFTLIAESKREPHLRPLEITNRILVPRDEANRKLEDENLYWVRDHWIDSSRLMKKHDKFNTAFRAFDSATIKGKTSSSLLALWGGLEQLFSSSNAELRFRVSAMIASFLKPSGTERLELHKHIVKLYDARSAAAHTSNDIEQKHLIATYVLMRNALVKMLDTNHVPTRNELDALLFGVPDEDEQIASKE